MGPTTGIASAIGRRCRKDTAGRTYTDFAFGFAAASLAFGLTAGLGIGAWLALQIGFSFQMPSAWAALLQSHGHAQLAGWAGLLIMGVSLYFVPRLAGVPLKHPMLASAAGVLVAGGLAVRAISQPLLAASSSVDHLTPVLATIVAFAGVTEAAGILCYLLALLPCLSGAPPIRNALRSVTSWLTAAVLGWTLFGGINAVLSLALDAGEGALLDIGWNRLGTDAFTHLVLIPVALTFSFRTFPLYLRLPSLDWHVNRVGWCYLVAALLELASMATILWSPESGDTSLYRLIAAWSRIIRSGLVIYSVWKLDLLFRVRPSWTVHRIGEPGPERRPTRPGLPDYGEFGRFEWCLLGAFGWLVLAAGMDISTGIAAATGLRSPFDSDAIRHAYLAGYIALLIFGMAPRMLPGFLHQRKVAFPELVGVTFWLAAAAAFLRIGPLLAGGWLGDTPILSATASTAFGLSGLFLWCATLLLAVNLLATKKRSLNSSPLGSEATT